MTSTNLENIFYKKLELQGFHRIHQSWQWEVMAPCSQVHYYVISPWSCTYLWGVVVYIPNLQPPRRLTRIMKTISSRSLRDSRLIATLQHSYGSQQLNLNIQSSFVLGALFRLAKDFPSSPFIILMHFGGALSSVSVYTLIFFVLMPNCDPKLTPCKTIPKTLKKLVITMPTKNRWTMNGKP